MSVFQWLGANKYRGTPKGTIQVKDCRLRIAFKFSIFYVHICVLCCQKDTLKWRVPNIISWHGGGVEAHSAGELAHQLVLKVLSAFILLSTVDKHLALR